MASTPELRKPILTIIDKRAADLADRAPERTPWVNLSSLRAKFGTAIPRERIDQALIDLVLSRTIRLIPESNQKTLTEADHAAAIWVGRQYCHLIIRDE
jgi:hypothetical protein